MRRLLLISAALASLIQAAPLVAHAAPQYSVRTACGTQAYTTGTDASPIMDVTGNACVSGTAAQGSTTAGQSGVLAEGAVTTAAPTYTTAQTSPLSLATNGALRVSVYGSDTVQASASALSSDAVNPASQGLYVLSANYGFDGTNYARVRGNIVGLGILEGGLPASHWSFASVAGGITNTTTAVTMKAAAGGVLRNCISNIQVTHALLGAATELAVRDGAAGTVLWRASLATPAVEGGSYNLTPAICGTANTLMEVVTLTATVTGGVVVSAQGYVSP